MRSFFIYLIAISLAVSAVGKGMPVFLKTSQILHIVVIDNMHDKRSADRNHYFESTFEELVEERAFPMACVIQEFGIRVPMNQPCVYVTIQKWGYSSLGQIEVRLSAYIRDPVTWTKKQLGIHVAESSKIPVGTIDSKKIAIYNETLKQALATLLDRVEPMVRHVPKSVSYTHLTLPTNREV